MNDFCSDAKYEPIFDGQQDSKETEKKKTRQHSNKH